MKNFLKLVGELKSWGCLSFTGSIFIYSAIDSILGGEYMRHTLIWQMLAMCGIITVLQYIFFSGRVLKKLSYFLRLMVFGVLIFGVCAGFAWACGWFPTGEPGAWATFVIIFVAAFLIFCVGFELYFRIMGAKYDGYLGRAQKKGEKITKL